jgi:hypothetical protein
MSEDVQWVELPVSEYNPPVAPYCKTVREALAWVRGQQYLAQPFERFPYVCVVVTLDWRWEADGPAVHGQGLGFAKCHPNDFARYNGALGHKIALGRAQDDLAMEVWWHWQPKRLGGMADLIAEWLKSMDRAAGTIRQILGH